MADLSGPYITLWPKIFAECESCFLGNLSPSSVMTGTISSNTLPIEVRLRLVTQGLMEVGIVLTLTCLLKFITMPSSSIAEQKQKVEEFCSVQGITSTLEFQAPKGFILARHELDGSIVGGYSTAPGICGPATQRKTCSSYSCMCSCWD